MTGSKAAREDITLIRWETLTKKKFDKLDLRECVVLVTCSPLEVHGPHLPFGTDLFEGDALTIRAIQHLPERHRRRTFLQLPFIYAATDPLPHRGSIHFRPSTTIAVLTDLGNSLAAQGFRDIVVSNFHGSPRHFLAIEQACADVSHERNIRMVSIFSIMLDRLTGGGSDLYEVLGGLCGTSGADFQGDTHGGLVETSQLLALHPELVEPDYASLPQRTLEIWMKEKRMPPPRAELGKQARLDDMLAGAQALFAYFCEETYAGKPGMASAELGDQILDLLGSRSAEAIAEIWDGRLPPEKWHSPLWKQRWFFIHPAFVAFTNKFLLKENAIA
jgi:creatinine amidohydrolase